MVYFIVIPASNLISMLLNTFFPIKIICYIDLRGRSTRSTRIKVLFIAFVPLLVFFSLFSIFVKGFSCFRGIVWKLILLSLWLKLFGLFKVFRTVCFVQIDMHWSIFIIVMLIHIIGIGCLHFGLYLSLDSFSDQFLPTI